MELTDHIFYTGISLLQGDGGALVDLTTNDAAYSEPFIRCTDDEERFVLYAANLHTRRRLANDPRVSAPRHPYLNALPYPRAALTLSVFNVTAHTLANRQDTLNTVYANTISGGGLILVEPVLGPSARWSCHLNNAAYFQREKRPLGAMQLPVDWHIDMLYEAGWQAVDCFYRSGNIAAILALRD